MSAEKKWNLQSFPSGTTLFGTNQTYTITCPGDNTFINLNQADLIVTMNITGLLSATYSVLRPSTAWISQINTTIQYMTERGPEIVNYNGYNNRGIAANVLEILEYSAPKFAQYSEIEFLAPTSGLTNTNFETLIPLKFLSDSSYDAQLLNIDYISFNITWESQDRIFSFTAGTPVVNTTKVDIKYPTITTTTKDIIPKHIREIPNRQIYIQQIDLLTGSNAANTNVSVPFPCSELFYFFVGLGNNYSLNPNPASVVTNHSLTSMGSIYPLVATYAANLTTGTTSIGLIRHFMELMDITGKDKPENNTTLTFANWRDNLRIYAIEIGTEQHVGQQFNFTSTFNVATTNPCTCVMIFVGRRHI